MTMGSIEEPKYITINYKHYFTELELKSLGETMAETMSNLDAKEDDKKSTVAAFTSELNVLKAMMTQLSQKILHKSEMRSGEAAIKLDHVRKERQYFLKSSGNLVSKEPFRDGDYQRELPMV